MDVIIFTPVRLLGESLAAYLGAGDDLRVVGVVSDWLGLERCLTVSSAALVIVDITQGIDMEEMRTFVCKWPAPLFLALGLREQRREVVDCGRAGFSGYVARDASLAQLRGAILDAAAGRLACSGEIAGELMRALYRIEFARPRMAVEHASGSDDLTRREGEVARCVAEGYSNKEIARHLNLSLATVKHHVHNILQKMRLPTRKRVARAMHGSPWRNTVG